MTAQPKDKTGSARSALLYVPLTFLLASLLSMLIAQVLPFLGIDVRWAIVVLPLLYLILLAFVARRQHIDQLDLLTAFGAGVAGLIVSHIAKGAVGAGWARELPVIALLALQALVWLGCYAALGYAWLEEIGSHSRNGQGTSLAS